VGISGGIDVTREKVCALVALAVVVGGLLAETSAAPPALSDDERRRLAAGEVVVQDAMPPGASDAARGGTAFAIVHASPDQVWRVLVDYPGHRRYYPRVVASEVMKTDTQRVLVRYQVAVGPFSFNFYMDKFPDPLRRRIEWHLADGLGHGMFRENSGYWQVDESGRASLVTYAIAVRMLLPAFVTLGAERASLTETITAMRKLVEEGDGATSRPK
jgi:ribosome-associated toxin RatA of RatAB toxin-antitoxin module